MMNLDLLKQLYCIHSKSGREQKFAGFLKKYVQGLGAKCKKDKTGNLLVTKGVSDSYPCIAAHIDQVQSVHSKDFMCIEGGGIIFGYSPKKKEQQGLGADDKNGVFIALECLAKYDVLKVAFFVGEEVGCVGSNAVDMSFFDDCRFVLQADRRNGSDLITEISGELCSDEFLDDIRYKDFGFVPTSGLTTDVGTLKERGLGVSCVNMSCGYYNPHTDHEVTDIPELENALRFVESIIENCTKAYPHEYRPSRGWCGWGWSKYGKPSLTNYEYDDDEYYMRTLMEYCEECPSFEDIMEEEGFYFYSDKGTLLQIYNTVVAEYFDADGTPKNHIGFTDTDCI